MLVKNPLFHPCLVCLGRLGLRSQVGDLSLRGFNRTAGGVGQGFGQYGK